MNVYYILLLTQNVKGLSKGYIPSGLTEEQWRDIKIKERNDKSKNYEQRYG